MSKKVKIIVDSGCDLSLSILQKLDVDVVPLNISFGAETFLDYTDLTPDIMLDKLRNSKENPKTSAPGITFFKERYIKFLEEGYDICVFCLSSVASSTYNVACMAKKEVEKERTFDGTIEVIDTKSFTLAYGLVVRDCAEMAQQGEGINEILGFVSDRLPKTRIAFCVSDLSYLKRGGRIKSSEAFIGGILGIVPVMIIKDGLVVPVSKSRGLKNAFNCIADIAESDNFVNNNRDFVIVECGRMDKVDMFCSVLTERLDLDFSPECFSLHGTIAAHTGPETIGIAYYCS